MNRRGVIGAGAALLAGTGTARAQHHGGNIPADQMSALRGPNPQGLTPGQLAQRVMDSPAPAGPPGRWYRARRCRCRAAKWPGRRPGRTGCM